MSDLPSAWIDDLIEAVQFELSRPKSTRDPNNLIMQVRRYNDKLLSLCHNGGHWGDDECPACRALRTEKAEKVVSDLEAQVEAAKAETVKAEADAAQWPARVSDLNTKLKKVEKKAEEIPLTYESQLRALRTKNITQQQDAQKELVAMTRRAQQAESRASRLRDKLATVDAFIKDW